MIKKKEENNQNAEQGEDSSDTISIIEASFHGEKPEKLEEEAICSIPFLY